MAQPADSLAIADLFGVKTGGLVKEEVHQEIQRLQKLLRIETLLLDRLGRGTVRSHRFEWIEDTLAEPLHAGSTDPFGAVYEASEYPLVTAATGLRKRNYTQYNTKAVNISDRNLKVDIHGRSDEMAYQTMKRIRELERDIESQIADGNNGSVQDNNNNARGRTAPLAVQIGADDADNVVANGTTGGGYDADTGLFSAIAVGTAGPVALDFDEFRDVVEAIYLAGGNANIFTSHPSVIKRLNEFLIGEGSSYAFVATVGQSPGTSTADLAANGWFTVIKTDFGTRIELIPNRSQRGYDAPVGTVSTPAAHGYLLDTSTIDVVYIEGITVEPLAKTGIYTRKGIKTDWGLRVNDAASNGCLRQLSLTAAVTGGPES